MTTVTTLLEAAKSSPSKLFQLMAMSIVTTDQLAAALPFRTFAGQAATFIREATLPDTEFIPDSGAMSAASTGTDDLVTVPCRRLASDLDVDSLADDLTDGAQTERQLAQKVKATWRKVKDKIANGGNITGFTISDNFPNGAYVDAMPAVAAWMDSNRFGPGLLRYTHTGTKLAFKAPGDSGFGDDVVCATDGSYTLYSQNKSKWVRLTLDVSDANADATRAIYFTSSTNEFDGMNKIIDPSMLLSSSGANGDSISFAKLDRMITMEKVRTNRAFIMPSQLLEKFMSLLRAVGGATPIHLTLPGLNGTVPSYRGIPILENDYIGATESKGEATTLSSIYLASLTAEEGLFVGVPGTGNDAIDVQGEPDRQTVLGWRIERLGARETVAHRRTRVQWYGMLGLISPLALVRASEIRTED